MRFFIILLYVVVLSACTGQGAVVFAPTPLPPDDSPIQYVHPGGAFLLNVPRDWTVYEQNTTTLAASHFTLIGEDAPTLSVAVIHLHDIVQYPQLSALINRYQGEVRTDLLRYTEQDRQAMGDGSWRIIGLRSTIGGILHQVNTFIVVKDNFVGVIDAVIPDDLAKRQFVEVAVNSFLINTDAELLPVTLSAFSAMVPGPIEVVNVNTWQTAEGVFFIAGEIANHSDEIVGQVDLVGQLQYSDGSPAKDELGTVMGYGILPGGFAPFGLRFGSGQPENTSYYALTLSERKGGEVYGAESMTWSNDLSMSPEGHILIDGVVTNISSTILQAPLVSVTVFDDTRNVIATGFTVVTEDALLPEESMDFHLRIPDVGGEPANYIVSVQALPEGS